MKTLTTFEAPERAKFMVQDTIQGPVMWVVSDEGNQKLFRVFLIEMQTPK